MPELVGHRGYPRQYPENTLIGIEAAIAAGARFIETDVQLTRDLIPVLFHDPDLTRICGVAGAIADYSHEELQKFSASEFERFGYKFAQTRIADLAELAGLLRRYPAVTAFIELKRISIERFDVPTVIERVWAALEPLGAQCVPISYALAPLAAARRHWPAVGAVIDRWRERRGEALCALRPEYLFCDVDGLPRFGKLQFPGAKLAVYEVVDPEIALRLAGRGVDLIETFAIGEMRRALALADAGA
ncbi:MAG: glycerophosphodiester phosphodiesterase [Gammaproteobacteria bacterium]|nr:glycerophosphodiester phosphodiesterase [Gammaproteobacteria bacterium]